MTLFSFTLLAYCVSADAKLAEKFSNVEIEKPFDAVLRADPVLMETSGAMLIKLDTNRNLIVGVASTVLKDESAAERLRAEKVCRIKALANVLADKQGVRVVRVETVKEKTIIKIENGKETATSVAEILQITKIEFDGAVASMPIVGRWRSADGVVFYLAVGQIVDDNGRPSPFAPR